MDMIGSPQKNFITFWWQCSVRAFFWNSWWFQLIGFSGRSGIMTVSLVEESFILLSWTSEFFWVGNGRFNSRCGSFRLQDERLSKVKIFTTFQLFNRAEALRSVSLWETRTTTLTLCSRVASLLENPFSFFLFPEHFSVSHNLTPFQSFFEVFEACDIWEPTSCVANGSSSRVVRLNFQSHSHICFTTTNVVLLSDDIV